MALNLEIQKSLRRQIPTIALQQTRKIVKSSFQKKKNEMIADFLNHPVSLEIKGGVEAENISGTLNGITNLFSFIGFEQGTDPLQPIIELLQKTNLDLGRTVGQKVVFSVILPTPKEIFEVTPLPYMPGRSWARSIETGLSGLGYYIKKPSNSSRSGLGIQVEKRVRKVKFANTKYISDFLKRYKKEFENIQL